MWCIITQPSLKPWRSILAEKLTKGIIHCIISAGHTLRHRRTQRALSAGHIAPPLPQPIEIRSKFCPSVLSAKSIICPAVYSRSQWSQTPLPSTPPTSYHHRHHHSQCLDRPCVSLPALLGVSLLAESSRYVLSSRIPPPRPQFGLHPRKPHLWLN